MRELTCLFFRFFPHLARGSKLRNAYGVLNAMHAPPGCFPEGHVNAGVREGASIPLGAISLVASLEKNARGGGTESPLFAEEGRTRGLH